MPAVLVHGVPETERVWDDLTNALSRDDVVALSLPGFGRPLPEGFTPTMDQYVDCLIGALERIDGPIDLVGHDWGGGFTLRVVSLRPDLVRTWVSDAAGLADVQFAWHQFATIWQTPDEGETFMDNWLSLPTEARAAGFGTTGEPGPAAVAMAEALDRTMTDSILSLYRSATKVHEEWGPAFVDIPKPGLVLVPSDDPFLTEDSARRAAERAGARVELIDGQGHWWMLSDPTRGARLLEDFWSTADG